MSPTVPTLSICGNSKTLTSAFTKQLKQPGVKIHDNCQDETNYLIFIVDLNETSPDFLLETKKTLSKTSQQKKCLLILTSSFSSPESLEIYLDSLQETIKNEENNIRCLVALDLYHPDLKTPLSFFERNLLQTFQTNKFNASPSGDNQHYPIHLDDLINSTLKSLFSLGHQGKVYYLLGETLTDLELGYLLKKAFAKHNQELDLNLGKVTSYNYDRYFQLTPASEADLNWLPKHNLTQEIDKLYTTYLENKDEIPLAIKEPVLETPPPKISLLAPLAQPLKVESKKLKSLFKRKPLKPISEDLHRVEKRGIVSILKIAFLILLLSIVVPSLTSLTSLYLTGKLVKHSLNSLRTGNLTAAKRNLAWSKGTYRLAVTSSRYLFLIGNLVDPTTVSSTNNYLILLDHTQAVLEDSFQIYSLTGSLYQSLIGKSSQNPADLSSALKTNLVNLQNNLTQIYLLINKIKLPLGLESSYLTDDLEPQIGLLRSQLNSSLPLLDLVNQITADQSLQRYLILVQDPNELRATGGYLNTVVLVTLEQGRVTSLETTSSLSLEQSMEGKVEAPPVLRQLLGTKNWLFRDSNLDADFGQASRQISWFYERFKNQKLNGIIGLNLSFLNLYLSEVGEINLDNNQKLTSENFYLLATNPTSDDQEDIITKTTRKFSDDLINNQLNLIAFFRAITKTIKQNEINLWFSDQRLELLSESANLAGLVKNQSCHPQLASFGCLNTTFYLNESNYSLNKTNYYLKRTQTHFIEINDSGNISHTATFDYSYPVPSPTNFDQNYKAYYQLYLPVGALNLDINLDNQSLVQAAIAQSSFDNLQKYEFSTSQALNQNHRLRIKYSLPSALNLKVPNLAFNLNLLKQAGTANDNFSLTLKYPVSLIPRTLTLPMHNSASGELNYATNETSQAAFGFLFKNSLL